MRNYSAEAFVFTTTGLCLMLEKMDFLFDRYKRKTLVSHTCPMKSPFTEVRVKVQKITQTKLFVMFMVKRKVVPKFLIFVNSSFLK